MRTTTVDVAQIAWRTEQDWLGAFAVVPVLLGLSLYVAAHEKGLTDRLYIRSVIAAHHLRTALGQWLSGLDHTTCDAYGCGVVLCACKDEEHTERTACPHHAMVCADHRFDECDQCDTESKAGASW